jgi:hypothetical protein
VLAHPLCSIRQDVELLSQQRQDEARFAMHLESWGVRTLAQFIVQTAQVDQTGFRKLWSQVKDISLDPDKQSAANDNRSIEEIIEQGAIVPDDRIVPGTFEAFGAFVNQANAAGRLATGAGG